MYPDIEQYTHNPADDPAAASAEIDAYLASIKPGAIRLASPFPTFSYFLAAAWGSGRDREFMDDERMTLDYGLRLAKNLPPIWVAQGTSDDLVGSPLVPRLYGSNFKIRSTRLIMACSGSQSSYR